MSCRIWKKQLASYAYGELDGASRTRCQEHLNACADCSREVATYSALRSWSGEAATSRPAPSNMPSWSSVRARIERRQLRRRPFLQTLRPILLASGATVLLLGCLFYGYSWLTGSGSQTEKPIAVAVSPGTGNVIKSPTPMPGNGARTETTVKVKKPAAKISASVVRKRVRPRTELAVNREENPSEPMNGQDTFSWEPRRSVAVELAPNSHTGEMDASVIKEHDSEVVIDT